MNTTPLGLAAFGACVTLFAAPAIAQWPTNPSTNLPVADGTGEQSVPKFAVTSDGGCYAAWFDNRGGSYAVRLQRLAAAGVELWPHNGILVSGNPQSTSLVDWDLICDSEDHCVLAFTDTRAGSDLDVYAYRVSPAGVQLWGNNGVTLSTNPYSEANPRVCEASDGDFVFVWPNTGTMTLQLQRLDRNGVARFPGDGIAIPGDPGATPAFARIVAADNGAVILSWVRAMAFTGNRHVHVQKYAAAGSPLWNGGVRLPVFDQASVPIAHEPRLVPDGLGGAVCAWHFAVGQQFSIRVQHVSAAGIELFPHNGVDVSGSTGSRFDPALVFRAATQETFVAWNERNLAQSQWGVFAQKLDAAGSRSWGATGVTLIPVNTTEKLVPVAAPLGDGFAVAVLETSLGNNRHKVLAFGLDGAGAQLWPPAAASTVASGKLRLHVDTTASGTLLLGWVDERAGSYDYDVYMQALDLAGALGVRLGAAAPYGCGVNPAGSLLTNGRPALGTTMQIGLTNPLGTQATGALSALVFGFGAPANYPCGIVTPGYGMAGPGQPGEVLVDLQQPNAALLGAPWAGPSSPSWFAFTPPLQAWAIGVVFFAQGVLLDTAPGAQVPIGLTGAVRLAIGS
ncbi:MAG: hypothetical protein FJ265_16570 [Planctomycetes bacterium]|nr:hypothetical protein [Planctomycetota bacterium]